MASFLYVRPSPENTSEPLPKKEEEKTTAPPPVTPPTVAAEKPKEKTEEEGSSIFTSMVIAVIGAGLLVLLLEIVQSPLLEPSVLPLTTANAYARTLLKSSGDLRTDRRVQIFIIAWFLFFLVALMAG